MRAAAPALALTLVLAAPAAAQQIRGRVVEAGTDRVITDAALIVSDEGGRERFRAVSDSAGRFVLTLPFAGRFTLHVEHLAFQSLDTEPFEVAADEQLDVEVRMARGVIPLDPLIVRGRETVPLGRLAGFYARMEGRDAGAWGRFFGREELEQYPGSTITNLIATVPGVRVRPVGMNNAVFMRGSVGDCVPAIFVDGVSVGPDFNTMIDDFASPETLEGIEVYRSALLTPIEYRRDGSCGAVLLWSRQGRGEGPFSWRKLFIGAGAFLGLVLLFGR